MTDTNELLPCSRNRRNSAASGVLRPIQGSEEIGRGASFPPPASDRSFFLRPATAPKNAGWRWVRTAVVLGVAALLGTACGAETIGGPVSELGGPGELDELEDDDASGDDSRGADDGEVEDEDDGHDDGQDDCLAGTEACGCDAGACERGLVCFEGECIACDAEWCAVCGNNFCDDVEDCDSCPGDCGSCQECGDGECVVGENCSTCPGDCGVCPPKPECGDKTCDVDDDETCRSCPDDCGACPVEPFCGDGTCQVGEGETCLSCSDDCGPSCQTYSGGHVCEGTVADAGCYDTSASLPGVATCTCGTDSDWVECGVCDTV